jgi:pteridine reductase
MPVPKPKIRPMSAASSPMTDIRPVALVTGAARRIGADIAVHLHGTGFEVIIHYRSSSNDANRLAQTLCSIRPGSAIALQADLSEAGQCARLVEEAAGWQGRLDALVNNASTFRRSPLGSIDEACWRELIDGNLKAAIFTSQAAAPWLRASGRGAIVNLCDVRTERPLPGFAVYSAAKAGIVALTRTLALELAPGVRVNAVSPGSLDWPEGVFDAAEIARIEDAIPLARLGNGDDIARAVCFLLTSASYITGHVLAVDGGSSLVSR